VRADRLLSLMLLLRSRGRMSATVLAAELEVSTRTVLRDIEALSSAGIPVYAERGRAGGFALLPGFTTDLTGLTPDEALALLTAGSRANVESLGMAPALASGMRKVLAAMPDARRATATRAAERVTVRRGGFLRDAEPDGGPLGAVRHAVFGGRRLRIRYAARNESSTGSWRTVDPLGLVNAAGSWYLLALRDGADRTYRVSRIREAVELDERAVRPDDIDLDQLWELRRARFAASLTPLRVTVRVRDRHRAELVRTALALHAEQPEAPGWARVELDYDGLEHAATALWRIGPDAQVLAPAALWRRLAQRAAAMAGTYPVPPG
jgi:predicted DNA-binding transcriptional regulator YafY